MRPFTLVLALALTSSACGDSDDTSDIGRADTSEADAGSVETGSSDGATDADVTDASDVCEGECATTTLTASFGDVSETFDVAYFGFNADGSLRIEAYGGAEEGCPRADSRTPSRTLDLASIVPAMRGDTASVQVSLLDFEGTLSEAPIERSERAQIVAGPSQLEGERFVRLALDATFSSGAVTGDLYATYCASLDE